MQKGAIACGASHKAFATSRARIASPLLGNAAQQISRIISQLLFLLIFALTMGNAHALTVTFDGMNRLTDPNAYENGSAWGGFALAQPGNKAYIDDQFINVAVRHGPSVPGDSFGTRVTNPSGTVYNNTVTMGADGCWLALFRSYCDYFSAGRWRFGTGIYMRVLGQWKVEVISNGAAISTDYFTLSPYVLNENSGNNQSISLLSVTPKPLQVKVLDPAGLPAGSKAVTFTVTSAPKGTSTARLTESSVYTGVGSATLQATTDASGMAKVYLQSANKAGSYNVAVTSALAPGNTLNYTVKAVNTNLLDQLAKEKNLGADPANSSNCGDAPASATSLSTPNPINIATGNKFRAESDYVGGGDLPLQFIRYYNSMSPRTGSMGVNWRSNYDREIKFVTVAAKGRKTTTVAEVLRPDGKVLKFTANNGAWVGDADVVDRLATVASGYSYTCGKDQVELYSSAGKLLSITTRDGLMQSFSYDTQGRLVSVQDGVGRRLEYGYDGANRLNWMLDPAGNSFSYAYDAVGNLESVTNPDGTRRQYRYENPSYPNALTGIVNENGERYATFTYDAQGMAVVSELAGGAARAEVTYYPNGDRIVTDGMGRQRKYTFNVIQGVARRTALDNGETANTSTMYDANGFVTATTDYNGVQTSYVRDARGLETSRTEAVGTPQARTITTTWHSSFRLPLTIAELGQLTRFSYDSAGRVTERTSTDTATSTGRTTTYAYDAQGLLSQVDGPRTDVSDITRYSYDVQGNLASMTNALGQVTTYAGYTAHGKPQTITDPNGMSSELRYDSRGRLQSRMVDGLITRFTYDGVGQMKRMTRPDGTWVEYQYDAAHRLVGIMDHQGNRMAYTLDVNGNIIRQDTRDSSDSLAQTKAWTYDQLNRITQELDALNRVHRSYRYDANGNRTQEIDALGQTTAYAYDALNRLITATDALSGVASYAYDARDNLTQVTSPNNVVTSYRYDGLNNRQQEISADAGTSQYTYDSAGNLKTRTWANGKAVTYTYDALNRVTMEQYAPGEVVRYSYDDTSAGNFGIGRLTRMEDATGSTQWQYDRNGRLVQKTQTIGSRVLITHYGYDTAGRLQYQTYPSGRQIRYDYTNGQLTGLAVDGQVLLDNITWRPFGPTSGWRKGNGSVVERKFDLDGRLSQHSFDNGTRSLSYDAKGRITSVTEPRRDLSFGYDANDRLQSETASGLTTSYSYDPNGNRLSQTEASTTNYSYIAGSNRLASRTGTNPASYNWDGAGNLLSDGQQTYRYNDRNRLASVAGWNYGHNGQGQRVSKQGATTSYFAWDEQGRMIGEYDATAPVQETVYLGDTPVAVLRAGSIYYIDTDHLGSPRLITDSANRAVWRWDADAFGRTAANANPTGLGNFTYPLRFPGQYLDQETELHYNYFRDYDPNTGRYSQSDPIGLKGGLNTFAYVENDPINRVDPFGLASCDGQWLKVRWTRDLFSWITLDCTCYWSCTSCKNSGRWDAFPDPNMGQYSTKGKIVFTAKPGVDFDPEKGDACQCGDPGPSNGCKGCK